MTITGYLLCTPLKFVADRSKIFIDIVYATDRVTLRGIMVTGEQGAEFYKSRITNFSFGYWEGNIWLEFEGYRSRKSYFFNPQNSGYFSKKKNEYPPESTNRER